MLLKPERKTDRLRRYISVLMMLLAMVISLDGCAKKPTQTQLNGQLFLAAVSGNVAQVQALLAAGADVNATTPDGRTALRMASQKGHADVVTLLKEAGAQ